MEMGIGNITANNGWAMFFVGYVTIIITFVVLALIVALMPKIIIFQEAFSPSGGPPPEDPPKAPAQAETVAVTATKAPAAPQKPLEELDVTAIVAEYAPFMSQLQAPFELRDVYAMAQRQALAHPHLSIRTLQEAGKIVPANDGKYTWNA